ncbi:hypothetical protein GCK72_002175 [Caenorhabditis remanei]|uniref:Uncharacterized protein n=1 Tax=Caenorhabditis remanei TaxID=31234 RepID=A0A6A5HVR0_CAERE|nr:hypothetical protein GCK72_002175 [Caenorhabditis remanei]KAF1770357.1 hypothetical protein GCK72_002175 [Caenorhabditis remanei]
MGKNSLKRAIELDVVDFAEHTSAHGIPRAYVSTGWRRYMWLLCFLFCLSCFGHQAYLIIERFNRNDIIVGVEIKFEEIKFPAVTVCNMNPYKNSAARELGAIRNALEAFEMAIDKSDGNAHSKRMKRSSNSKMIAVDLMCKEEHGMLMANEFGHLECTCITFDDSETNEEDDEMYWNCHLKNDWNHRICHVAEEHNQLKTCKCHEENCIEDGVTKQMMWPLQMKRNGTKLCISVESGGPSYCANSQKFEVSKCKSCDWLGKCEEKNEEEHGVEEEKKSCICHRGNCFQIKNNSKVGMEVSTEFNSRVRVFQKKKRRVPERKVHERLLSRYEGLLAVYSHCNCTTQHGCVSTSVPDMDLENSNKTCLCFYNQKNEQVWPCYKEPEWEERKCSRCNTLGDCVYTDKPKKQNISCLCATPIKMCVRIDPPQTNETTLDDRIVKFWDIQPSTTMSPIVKKKEERDKAYGYSGVKDRIALRAKAMENIIFAVDALTESQKWQISYDKSDFIMKCSFNGQECNVKHDFVEYLDPTYGACFTYGQKLGNITNERSGPAYGLRLEVFVNVTEYLPTTEAAGVRLTVHATDEQPFPDTLGFSAPTGFVSSFGIKLKSMVRLPAPYGDCVQEGKTEDFIYTQKAYNTEGCQRSCIQKHLSQTCGCGDPRFPPYRESKNCPVDDPYKRECIKNEMHVATRDSKKLGCSCKQPCNQDVYSVSYSASRWPAIAGDLSGCPHGMAAQHCLMYKREQGSMIEVYFEQLNYESLLESEAYGWSNLLSDFGGQLGLWMGVSVITIGEVACFFFEVFISIISSNRTKRRPARKSFSSSLRCSTDYNLNKDGFNLDN